MEKYVRKVVKNFKPYKVNKLDYRVKLDANEGIKWNEDLNRYPDDSAEYLISKLSIWLNKTPEQLIVGNGSSELIEMVMKTFLDPGEVLVSFEPTFSLYSMFTTLYNGIYEGYQMDESFKLNVGQFIDFANEKKAKIVLVSNPNNPTGRSIPIKDVIEIVENVDAIIVLDEAYVEFGGDSAIDYVEKYNNLVVLRTFSKAIALAGIRLGYLVASEELTSYVKRVRSPYNLNALSQEIGLTVFDKLDMIADNVQIIKDERAKLEKALDELGLNPVPSDANFILFKCEQDLWDSLVAEGVLIRQFGGDLSGYYRITVGTEAENKMAIESLRRSLK
jgi:histidinol-phosphate aminotransferase